MISIIAALTKNNVIGKNGTITWKIKGEQKRLKELTLNKIVIMGRKTFEDIGKPLPNRFNIVVSLTKNYHSENCITVTSLNDALKIANDKDAFIIGGTKLFEEALPIADKLYLTEIDLEIEGDTFFPSFDKTKYDVEINKIITDKISYKYLTFTKK